MSRLARGSLFVVVALLWVVLDAGALPAQPPEKPVYAAFTTDAPGLEKLPTLYQNRLLPRGEPDTINADKIAAAVRGFPGGSLVCLNLEHWPLKTPDDIRENLPRYLEVLRLAREARPDLRFGYYMLVPSRDYWSPVLDKRKGTDERTEVWRRRNDSLQRLADASDVLFPSLYVFYDRVDDWQTFAETNIAEARRMARGKPVLPVVWGLYHGSNKTLGLQPISQEYAERVLRVCREHADGVVIWAHPTRQKDFPLLEALTAEN